jgi:hypothetical protein
MSVSTPILTTSSEICALADAAAKSAAAQEAAARDRRELIRMFPSPVGFVFI